MIGPTSVGGIPTAHRDFETPNLKAIKRFWNIIELSNSEQHQFESCKMEYIVVKVNLLPQKCHLY